DNFNGIVPHLNQRDVTFVAISRAPVPKLQAFAKRLGWTFKWLSSDGSDFNQDYGVFFTPEDLAAGTATYNYAPRTMTKSDLPGISVFFKDADGAVFHTYSCYARGLDMLNTAYNFLDLVPEGRGEDGLPFRMTWVRIRDEYDAREDRR
ncbi:MAG: CalU12 protein, partial [Rhodospirillales bacterium]|nr:CalU12 protein [Rhodospirillales bacterium]